MIVYVVEYSDGYDESGICEIFADEDKAEKYAEFQENDPDNINEDGNRCMVFKVTRWFVL